MNIFCRTISPASWTKLILLLLCGAVHAQLPRPTPPPQPAVAPLISRTYKNDADQSKLEDALQDRVAKKRTALAGAKTGSAKATATVELEAVVDVELIFTEQVTQKQIDDFLAQGGAITHLYESVSFGWNGRIALSKVADLPGLLGGTLVLVQEAKVAQLLMDKATQTGRVRPIWSPNFAGNSLGYSGSSNTTIGILDTGIDESHPDLNGRRVYWKDFTPDNLSTPSDVGQHGSHVAGIAIGSGVAGGSGTSTLLWTQTGSLGTGGVGNFSPSLFEIPVSPVTVTLIATWTGGGSRDLALVYSPKPAGSSFSFQSVSVNGPSPLTYTVAFTPDAARNYSPYFPSNGTATNYVIKCQIAGYAGVGDGFNKMRGVAPGCNWAGAKVFVDAGGGNNNYTNAAIDDLVTNRVADNIKIMNLSLGTVGSPGLDESERQKINTAVNSGIVVAVAAGNDAGAEQVDDPGRAAMALTVAATNDANQVTTYSSTGFATPGATEDFKPDLAAPGGSTGQYSGMMAVDSNSSDGTAFGDQQANDYRNIQGTSMATPFVAGCAALVIDALQQSGVTWDFTSSQHSRLVKMLLCATASETNSNRENNLFNPTLQRAAVGPNGFPAGKDQYEGYGMINPDAAIEGATLFYTPGASATDTFAGGTTDRRAWARKISLGLNQTFTPTLTNPSGGDFDLYLYSYSPSATGTPVLLASSTTAADGGTESLSHTTSSPGSVLLVVKRVSGSGTFSLNAPASAPTILTPTVASISLTSATLGGNVESANGATITERGVVYSATSTNANPLIDGSGVTKLSTSGTTGVFTINATGLTAGIDYSFKAYTTNSQGTSYTTIVSFTPGVPIITTPTIASITFSSVTLGATVVIDNGAAITERGVVYSVTGTNANPLIGGSSVTQLSVAGTTGVFTVNAPGLVAGTNYSFKAYAKNSVTTSYTAVGTFLIPIGAPTVTTLAATSVTGTSATLRALVTANGASTDAIIQYGTTTSYTLAFYATPSPVTGLTPMTVILPRTGLTVHTTYHYQAVAINSAGTTFGADQTFFTNSTPVATPQSGISANEDVAKTIPLAGTDADSDALTFAVAAQPAHGVVTILAATATYTPSPNYSGTDSFTFTANDAFGGISVAATVSLTVLPGNTAPTITSNGGLSTASISVVENTTAVTTVMAIDNDLPVQTITFSKSGTDAALFNLNSSGVLTFITAPDFESAHGPIYVVTVTATDNGTPTTLSDSQDLIITMTDVADTPQQLWRTANFAGVFSNTGNAANSADPDADGYSNLLEYAFGTDPNNPASGPGEVTFNAGTISLRAQPKLTVTNTATGVAFRANFGRRKDYVAAGLTYTVQFSADTVTWQNSAAIPTVLASDAEMDAVYVKYPFFLQDGRKAQFYRVEVSVP